MEQNIKFIRSVSKATPHPIAALESSEQVKLVYSNGRAEEILGYTKDELQDLSKNNFEQLIHPVDYDSFCQKLTELINSEEGEIIKFNFRIKRSDGNYLYWLARDIVFERDHELETIKFATVIQDITQVVILEERLASAIDKLNLISFKNSHDLRGPVASILGLMELMKLEDFHSLYNHKIFKHLEAAVIKLDQVIRDISDISNH